MTEGVFDHLPKSEQLQAHIANHILQLSMEAFLPDDKYLFKYRQMLSGKDGQDGEWSEELPRVDLIVKASTYRRRKEPHFYSLVLIIGFVLRLQTSTSVSIFNVCQLPISSQSHPIFHVRYSRQLAPRLIFKKGNDWRLSPSRRPEPNENRDRRSVSGCSAKATCMSGQMASKRGYFVRRWSPEVASTQMEWKSSPSRRDRRCNSTLPKAALNEVFIYLSRCISMAVRTYQGHHHYFGRMVDLCHRCHTDNLGHDLPSYSWAGCDFCHLQRE
jgi:hypothetical protein